MTFYDGLGNEFVEGLQPEDQPEIGGSWAYVDGSCDTGPVRELRRAGWAVIFVDDAGRKRCALRGLVWAHLPNTPQAAEHVS